MKCVHLNREDIIGVAAYNADCTKALQQEQIFVLLFKDGKVTLVYSN